jgi:hypothetical protein
MFVAIFCTFLFTENCTLLFASYNILKCIPQLWGIFEKYYNESPSVLSLYTYEEKNEPYELSLSISGKDPSHMISIIPELANNFIVTDGLLHNQAKTFVSKDLEAFPKYLGINAPQVGGQYLIKGLRFFNGENFENRFITNETLDYVAMFILSICVRYKQVLWGQIISGETSGVLSLIELHISSIKRRFPNKILDTFFNERFIYGTTGYF